MNLKASMRRDPDKIRIGKEMVREVYSRSDVGGSLHVVVDDQNIDDSSLLFCIDWALNYFGSTDEYWGSLDLPHEIRTAAFLLTCSAAERYAICYDWNNKHGQFTDTNPDGLHKAEIKGESK